MTWRGSGARKGRPDGGWISGSSGACPPCDAAGNSVRMHGRQRGVRRRVSCSRPTRRREGAWITSKRRPVRQVAVRGRRKAALFVFLSAAFRRPRSRLPQTLGREAPRGRRCVAGVLPVMKRHTRLDRAHAPADADRTGDPCSRFAPQAHGEPHTDRSDARAPRRKLASRRRGDCLASRRVGIPPRRRRACRSSRAPPSKPCRRCPSSRAAPPTASASGRRRSRWPAVRTPARIRTPASPPPCWSAPA